MPDPIATSSRSDKPDALVVFMPSGRRGRFPHGTPLLQAARSLGVDIDSVCGGRGICGRCQVEVSEGERSWLYDPDKPAPLPRPSYVDISGSPYSFTERAKIETVKLEAKNAAPPQTVGYQGPALTNEDVRRLEHPDEFR